MTFVIPSEYVDPEKLIVHADRKVVEGGHHGAGEAILLAGILRELVLLRAELAAVREARSAKGT